MSENNGNDKNESLRTQLTTLNERSRWYSSQLWQVPFAFLGIAGLLLGAVIDKENAVIGIILLCIGIFGITVILHISGISDGERRAVQNIEIVENKLHLEKTVLWKPIYWLPLQVAVIAATISSIIIGFYLLSN